MTPPFHTLSDATQIFPETDGLARLAEGELRIKFGVDPTSSNLHLGHAVALRQLRRLQDQGHQVLLVIGNFTAAIGDPTGRNTTRPPLSPEQIDQHARTYLDQAFKILDAPKTEVHWNRDWLGTMSAADLVALASTATVAQMAQRSDFSKRIAAQTPISLHEFLYPLLQAQDSVHLQCDAELGGTDQTFNLMMGRHLQSQVGQKPQVVLTVPILVGLDGERKMSKSYGNEVGLAEDPVVQFSKIMQIADSQIEEWGDLLTDTTSQEWVRKRLSANPRDVKFELATQIVSWLSGPEVGEAAGQSWHVAVRDRVATEETPCITVDTPQGGISLVEMLLGTGLATSKTVARQKVHEGAVRWSGERLMDPCHTFLDGDDGLLQVGKKHFRRVIVREDPTLSQRSKIHP